MGRVAWGYVGLRLRRFGGGGMMGGMSMCGRGMVG